MSKPFTDGTKVRVYSLAKALEKTSKELLPVLQELGYEVKSAQSTLTEDDANAAFQRLTSKKKSSKSSSSKKKATKKEDGKEKATKKGTSKKKEEAASKEEKPKKSSRTKKKADDDKEQPAKKPSKRKSSKKAKEERAEEPAKDTAAEPAKGDEGSQEFQAFSLHYLEEYLRLGGFDASASLGELKSSGSENRTKHTQTLVIHSREGQFLFGNSRSKIFFADLRHLMNKMCRQQFSVNVHFYFEIEVEGEAKDAKTEKKSARKESEKPKKSSAPAPAPEAETTEEPLVEDDFTRAIQRLAEQAKEHNKAYILSCMSPKDRHRVHSALAHGEGQGVKTVSDGEGIFRRLMIVPEELPIRKRPAPSQSRR